jgi:CheY-like chemotaxis protein
MFDLSHIVRILVLEDEGLIALDIEATLQDAGVSEVVCVPSVAEALRAIDGAEFDAAILDIRIGADGWAYDVARGLKQKGVPFIFSSGSVEIAEPFRDIPLVTKPFSSEQLIEALAGMLPPHGIRAAE